MCGIAGKLSLKSQPVAREEIDAMLNPMSHRGPDARGFHLDRELGLGHLRLSIIDLSPLGSQPMTNEDQTVWIVFNGEIYNFQELRTRLIAKGHVFRSDSDTEAIIHAYEEFGVDCVRELRGMFAFALWDSKRRRLFLARDRVGIKPLYICQTSDALLFSSEIKGILADCAVPREVSPSAIRQFLAFYYLPNEETSLRGIKKLLPGHYLLVENGQITHRQYWDLRFSRERWSTSFDKAVEELFELLRTTVREHMIADVPVGVLLSGGVDSSAVLSFAVSQTNRELKTFTVGFDGAGVVDERPYARLAAQTFKTRHYEITITPNEFWEFLPKYVWHMEEPVCEPPAVALYYVSKLAREHVKVILSGEGGDEAFGGYPNYPNMMCLKRVERSLGPAARAVGAAAQFGSGILNMPRVNRYSRYLGRPLSECYFSRSSDPSAYFNRPDCPLYTDAFRSEVADVSPRKTVTRLMRSVAGGTLLEQMLYLDTKTWLPDDLLIKADKITMANSLELRVPLLDHKVLEFAASLPDHYKVEGKETKRALKAAFTKLLPTEIVTRKKAGFPVPYGRWIQREFRNHTRDTLLSPQALVRGYFERPALESLLNTNEKTGAYPKEVFSLLVLEIWLRQFSAPAPKR